MNRELELELKNHEMCNTLIILFEKLGFSTKDRFDIIFNKKNNTLITGIELDDNDLEPDDYHCLCKISLLKFLKETLSPTKKYDLYLDPLSDYLEIKESTETRIIYDFENCDLTSNIKYYLFELSNRFGFNICIEEY
jgi:hypothetical protein